MLKDSISVFFGTDNGYAVPTYLALYSLLYNHKDKSGIDAYIMIPEAFSNKNIRLIKSLEDMYPCLRIRIINMENSYDSVAINSGHVSKATMYRLMIPRIVKQFTDGDFEKCIYLDSDIIVEGDISDLYSIDLKGNCIGAVRDRILSSAKYGKMAYISNLSKSLDIPTLKDYVNAGVLLIDLKAIRECGIEKELEETGYRNDFRYNDQDVINKVLFGKIKTIPLRFNVMSSCRYHKGKDFDDQYGSQNIMEARRHPVIIHYILRRKPWSCKTMIEADRWWKYAQMQDREIWEEYILPFVSECKAPFRERTRETVKTLMIKTRVYNLAKAGYYWLKS